MVRAMCFGLRTISQYAPAEPLQNPERVSTYDDVGGGELNSDDVVTTVGPTSLVPELMR